MLSPAVLVLAVAAAAASDGSNAVQPSTHAAAQRGAGVFNAVFDSLRKYGTTVHPNGMSLYLATVAAGVLLHHGNGRNATPTTLDWLAYEIEHAEIFARSRMGHPGGEPPAVVRGPQVVLADGGGDDGTGTGHGWLHTYRTTRPLQFLYIDGMSGDKSDDGVIDTQDLILRASPAGNIAQKTVPTTARETSTPRPPGPPGEFVRAADICELCAQWHLQGVIRTEGAGTEIIKCDFFDGLEQVQSLRQPNNADRWPGSPGGGPGAPGGRPGAPGYPGERPSDPGAPGRPGGGPGRPSGPNSRHGRTTGPVNFEDGFRDVGAHRTLIDYGSMVSAYFFPVNLTNPDAARAAYPRLVGAAPAELRAIKAYLAEVVAARRGLTPAPDAAGASWRDLADLVVRRYAPRLTLLANASSTSTSTSTAAAAADDMARNLRATLNVFVDDAVEDVHQREAEARARCATFYLPVAATAHSADPFLYAAFKAVNAAICNALFDALDTVADVPAAESRSAVDAAKASLQRLMEYLDWSVFEQ